jgi:cytochrome c
MKSILICALSAAAVLTSTAALANADLAKKSNCLACHQIDKKLVGPAYQDVAKKYAGQKDAEAMLFDRVKKGSDATGGPHWKAVTGGVPMPPNVMVKDDDIRTLVKWILAGAK